MLFLTEVKHQKRPVSSHHISSASANRFTAMKFTKQDILKNGGKSKSVQGHNVSRQKKSNLELEKEIDQIKSRSNAKEKWNKIV